MRLIDADALKFDIMCVYGSNPQYLNWLNHAPTVELTPIIRCKDCARHDKDGYCFEHGKKTDGADFCAWAKMGEE